METLRKIGKGKKRKYLENEENNMGGVWKMYGKKEKG